MWINTSYTRRFLGGRQPLCGSGVTSSMPLIFRPAFWSCRIACSRPAPGPLTFTSISIIPLLRASAAAFSAARPAANGVLLRAPLNPTVPADAHEIVSPLVSVMVTIVLLNVALMWATPLVTPLRIFFFAPGFAPAAVLACSPMIAACLSLADRPDYAVPAVPLSSANLKHEDVKHDESASSRFTFHVSCFMFHVLLTEFLHALLAGDRLARALAGAGVGAGALAADGEAATVAEATVAADLAEAADVLLDVAPPGAF